MTLGKLLEDVKLYDTVAIYRNDTIDGAEEFWCDSSELIHEASGYEDEKNLLECDVLSMFAKTLDDGQVVLAIGLDWGGDVPLGF